MTAEASPGTNPAAYHGNGVRDPSPASPHTNDQIAEVVRTIAGRYAGCSDPVELCDAAGEVTQALFQMQVMSYTETHFFERASRVVATTRYYTAEFWSSITWWWDVPPPDQPTLRKLR